MPIDGFLQALAKDRQNMAFGMILSGTASDGTLGARAVKVEGGITFAQEEQNACITSSFSFTSIWMLSSSSGPTSTAANDVCRVSPLPNGLIRTRRCTPISLC